MCPFDDMPEETPSASEWQIRRILHRYCDTIDAGDFEAFAAIFERGTWAILEEPGSDAVLRWLKQNVILYDGEPRTKHQMTNLIVDVDDEAGTATFSCYVTVWQALPDFPLQAFSQAKFRGTFEREDGKWWWKRHDSVLGGLGDTSHHLRNWQGVPPKDW